MELKQDVKVFLKGESPWAIITEIIDETHIKAKINNDLVNTKEHGISLGDILNFELQEIVEGYPNWEHVLSDKFDNKSKGRDTIMRCEICNNFVDIENEDKTDQIAMCNNCRYNLVNEFTTTIYKTFTIEIAHMLPGHPTCGVVHGHSMDITVGVTGPVNLKTGMVIDFKVIKSFVKEIVIDKFDHSYLNDTFKIPTAEILSYYIFSKLKYNNLNVTVVRVHETKNNYAEIRAN